MENLIPINGPNGILKTSESLIRKWLVILADVYQFDSPKPKPDIPSFADIWVLALADLDANTLNAAFQKLIKTWKPDYGRKFPTPADLRTLLEEARQLALAQQAETDWQGALNRIREQFHPDFGWRGNPLEGLMLPAVLAAGGISYLWNASDEQLIWAKKEFVEFYRRDEQLKEYAALLAPEVRALLADS